MDVSGDWVNGGFCFVFGDAPCSRRTVSRAESLSASTTASMKWLSCAAAELYSKAVGDTMRISFVLWAWPPKIELKRLTKASPGHLLVWLEL